MENIVGPTSNRRHLLMSTMLAALDKQVYRKHLPQVQTRGALLVTPIYCTVAELAVMVIALLAKKHTSGRQVICPEKRQLALLSSNNLRKMRQTGGKLRG